MSLSVTEDIKSISDLKKKTREILDQIHRTGRPVVVTVNGKPDVVLLDAAVFKKKLKVLNMARLLAEAELDVRNGKARSEREFLKILRVDSREGYRCGV